MLDGAARIGDLFSEAARMGMPALATTDHGYVFGAYEFWKKSQGTGVKPIIGVEAYITPGTHRSDRTKVSWGDGGRDDISGGGAYTHMTMLAENNEGMHNLFRMSSIASLDQVYTKWPRIDRELLSTYGKGLIVTTGCPSSEIQTKLRFGMYDEAREVAGELRDIFGNDNVYVELMDHGLEIERRTQRDLIRLARDLGLPLVATNDLHYTRAEDAKAHAALLCVQSGSTLMDPNRFKFDADDFYLKSAAEMRHLWRELPEACDNTLLIAERCEVSFEEGEGRYMPRFPCPPGEDETSWFIKEVETGLQRRFPEGVPDYARKQAAFEEDVIVSKGYPGYFLVVADFINWAKRNGIRVGPGRGSGAGSMCAYAMGITDLDPVPHGLIFERFLNPERPVAARLRRRLRRAPARRGHPLRHREVRRGAGRPDRHLRHDQGQAGRQGREPRARAPVRDGREAHQGDAARDHGQGHPARRHLRPAAQALQRGRRLPGRARRGPGGAGGRRDGAGPRGPEAPVGRACRRRHHEQRAAHRRHPDHAPPAGRADDHPVRLPELRVARPGQDGLPRPAQPHDPRRRPREHQAQPRPRHRPRRAVQGHDRPGHLRPARARRHPRRLPARRRRHAGPAAPHAARQLRGHLGRPRALPTRARWASTRTPTSRCARTASRSSSRSTRSSRASSSRR